MQIPLVVCSCEEATVVWLHSCHVTCGILLRQISANVVQTSVHAVTEFADSLNAECRKTHTRNLMQQVNCRV